MCSMLVTQVVLVAGNVAPLAVLPLYITSWPT